ncbi:MAG: hypothetical protein HGA76_11815, partial [Candidatus Firestonebacteria bacterium]|nr:hypothetical protein [Candidatus Firestonebacteria bacterium]
ANKAWAGMDARHPYDMQYLYLLQKTANDAGALLEQMGWEKPAAREYFRTEYSARGNNLRFWEGLPWALLSWLPVGLSSWLQPQGNAGLPQSFMILAMFLTARTLFLGAAEWLIKGRRLGVGEHGLIYWDHGKLGFNLAPNPEFTTWRRGLAYLGYIPFLSVAMLALFHEAMHQWTENENLIYLAEAVLFGGVVMALPNLLWLPVFIGMSLLAFVPSVVTRVRGYLAGRAVKETISAAMPESLETQSDALQEAARVSDFGIFFGREFVGRLQQYFGNPSVSGRTERALLKDSIFLGEDAKRILSDLFRFRKAKNVSGQLKAWDALNRLLVRNGAFMYARVENAEASARILPYAFEIVETQNLVGVKYVVLQGLPGQDTALAPRAFPVRPRLAVVSRDHIRTMALRVVFPIMGENSPDYLDEKLFGKSGEAARAIIRYTLSGYLGETSMLYAVYLGQGLAQRERLLDAILNGLKDKADQAKVRNWAESLPLILNAGELERFRNLTIQSKVPFSEELVAFNREISRQGAAYEDVLDKVAILLTDFEKRRLIQQAMGSDLADAIELSLPESEYPLFDLASLLLKAAWEPNENGTTIIREGSNYLALLISLLGIGERPSVSEYRKRNLPNHFDVPGALLYLGQIERMHPEQLREARREAHVMLRNERRYHANPSGERSGFFDPTEVGLDENRDFSPENLGERIS